MGVSYRKTFPSQHATLSAFAAVYVSVSAAPHPRCPTGTNCPDHPPVPRQMYFNSVISDTTKLLKPILVFSFAIAAGVCGLTQITQYRSHPVDVYAGFLIGASIAAYLVRGRIGRPEGEGQPPLPTPAQGDAAIFSLGSWRQTLMSPDLPNVQSNQKPEFVLWGKRWTSPSLTPKACLWPSGDPSLQPQASHPVPISSLGLPCSGQLPGPTSRETSGRGAN